MLKSQCWFRPLYIGDPAFLKTSTMPEDSTQINVVAARLPDFSSQEPLTWFRRAETRFRIRGITQPTTKADYVLEALPEEIFRRIGPWLDQQADEIPYEDLLKEFSPTTSERARRLLMMPSQPIGDRKPSELWNEICALSRLPEVDEVTKQHKEVDMKKEIWLQSLPSSVRVLLHNTDDKSMDELSTLADNITTSQNAVHSPTVSNTAVRQHNIDEVMPVRQEGAHTERVEVRAPIESGRLCYYHRRFGSDARYCEKGCTWSPKNSRSGRFLRRTAANALHPHPSDAHSATHPSHPGFFIKDELSDHRFLVDTGAFRSILPPSQDNNPTLQPSSAALVAANGTSTRTYSEQEVNIRLSGQTYIWTFIIADVRHPLLGADFLSHYSLVVDVARHRLLNTDIYTSVPLCISNVEENINLLFTDDTYSDIINDFDDVFKPELRLSPGTAAKHGVEHYIKTNGPLVHSRYRRLRPELHQIAKDAFTEMEKMGVCSKAASPWASPLHMTPKKDCTWRPCGDYRRLNLITEPDHYAMPNISDLTSSISTSRVFSKFDLLKGYFQVPVN